VISNTAFFQLNIGITLLKRESSTGTETWPEAAQHSTRRSETGKRKTLSSLHDIIQTDWGRHFTYCGQGHGDERTGEYRGHEYVDLHLNSRTRIQNEVQI